MNKELATPEDVSRHLAVPMATLSQWRYLRTGPQYLHVGRHVRYRWADVERWLDTQTRGGGDAA